MIRPVLRIATLLLPLALLTGCVDRLISVKSDPPGADVFLDGEKVGTTPVVIPYVWYGTREIVTTKRGYRSDVRMIPLNAPWWQVFPFDFLTDVVIPFPFTDNLEVTVTLDADTTDREEVDRILERARQAREKVIPPPAK